MKKRLISGIAAAAILIPTAAFAAPALLEILTRTPMTAEQVQVDEVGKATLEKLYRAFPETKSFAIIDVSNVQGVQTSITLQDKSGSGKKFTFHTNSSTGTIEHIIQENDGGSEKKPLIASTEQEIKAKVEGFFTINGKKVTRKRQRLQKCSSCGSFAFSSTTGMTDGVTGQRRALAKMALRRFVL
ncbi:hypothetical protein ACWKW1_03320 [Brevibacillus parabrevis]